jgi:hypothetical protein
MESTTRPDKKTSLMAIGVEFVGRLLIFGEILCCASLVA